MDPHPTARYSVPKAARIIGVHYNTLRAWLRRGLLGPDCSTRRILTDADLAAARACLVDLPSREAARLAKLHASNVGLGQRRLAQNSTLRAKRALVAARNTINAYNRSFSQRTKSLP